MNEGKTYPSRAHGYHAVHARPVCLKPYYEEFVELHGARPRALEAFHEGYDPRSARAAHGTWLGFVASSRRSAA